MARFFFFPPAFKFGFGTFGSDVITTQGTQDFILSFWGDDTIGTGGGKDTIIADSGDDSVDAGDGNDVVRAGRGDDVVRGGAGDDDLRGGRGQDAAVFSGSFADYTIQQKGNRWIVEGPDGRDTLRGFEELRFDDVTIFLDGRNNGPQTAGDAVEATENGATLIPVADLLANDSDFDGDTLAVTAVSSSTVGVTVTLVDGEVSYDPGTAFDSLAVGETATDTFSYTVEDGNGGVAVETVTVTITGENDAPELTLPEAADLAENETGPVATALASDVDGDTVTLTLSGADAALFTLDQRTGEISFAAAPDFEAAADADGDNVYEVTVTAEDGNGGAVSRDLSVTVTDVDEGPAPRINEFHYDNSGTDVGEFIELRVPLGVDPTSLSVVLYNGSNGAPYNTLSLPTDATSTDDTFSYYVIELPSNGLQNGAPDGMALLQDGAVVEFLSYEGVMTATAGPAEGLTSTDVGVSESSATEVGQSLQRNEDGDTDPTNDTWRGAEAETKGFDNDFVEPVAPARINEFHYDNAGGDVGEFIEIRVPAGTDPETLEVVLYNGNGGAPYNTLSLPMDASSEDDSFAYYVIELPTNGLQNGAPDGIALIQDDAVVEFLSYEGSFTATSGPAEGLTSTDIGVSEPSSTEIGQSLQRNEDGDVDPSNDTWRGPEAETRGTENVAGPDPDAPPSRINEFHYDNGGNDVGEFVEVRVPLGADASALEIILYNGNSGAAYQTRALPATPTSTDDAYAYYVVDTPGIQNGSPDGIALVNDGTVVEFLSYEGVMTAIDGPAEGLISTQVVDADGAPVQETSTTPAAQSLQRNDDGDDDPTNDTWTGPENETRGEANGGVVNPPNPTEPTLISAVQGSGTESALVGQTVTVEGIVTYVSDDGFYLQEEATDEDADSTTSEGIFVFTGSNSFPGNTLVAVGQTVSATGAVSEFFGQTQITDFAPVVVDANISALPAATQIVVSTEDNSALYESVEGMRVSVVSGEPDAALTVTTNFNLDRFGEIVVSAGIKTQPTQLFDAQTEAAEVAALSEANANNGLIIEDGDFGSNPTEFAFIPNTDPGDDGDGILDADDDFSQGGTLRLGAEITAPVEGIMVEAFGAYRVYATETMQVDPSTNTGARPATPDDVLGNGGGGAESGQLIVSSFNVLNYFTTLGERGASTADDLDRQTEKLVNAVLTSESDVLALQEIENNGFTDAAAIGRFVDELNAADPTADWRFVDPTGTGAPIGTDAITTGIIYNANEVRLVYSDALVFDEASAADTFANAAILNEFASSDDQVGDFQRNRPATVATFEELDTGKAFTVVSVHFKSKGDSNLEDVIADAEAALSAGTVPADRVDEVNQAIADLRADPNFDQGDGQGFWNQVRLDASEELLSWLDTTYLPAASAAGAAIGVTVEDETLVLGDFNAYAQEDPTQAARDFDGSDLNTEADYFDIIDEVAGGQDTAYSFAFDGQRGTLDQGFASESLRDTITGATEWHINADEPDLLNYNSRFNDARFFDGNVFAASDHDPLIIGLDFNDNPLVS